MIYLAGYFQSQQYFIESYDLIIDLYIKKLFGRRCVYVNECVCIHIRCGDYIGNNEFFVCTSEYYIRALNLIKKINPTVVVQVFSDDINYVKKKIALKYPCIYNEIQSEFKTINAMRSCKYFILSNSSFSWWAQELCEYEDKVVVAPAKWYRNVPRTFIHDKNWILLQT